MMASDAEADTCDEEGETVGGVLVESLASHAALELNRARRLRIHERRALARSFHPASNSAGGGGSPGCEDKPGHGAEPAARNLSFRPIGVPRLGLQRRVAAHAHDNAAAGKDVRVNSYAPTALRPGIPARATFKKNEQRDYTIEIPYNYRLELKLSVSEGEPDLFVSADGTKPTRASHAWTTAKGSDTLTISSHDPDFTSGPLLICVHAGASAAALTLLARMTLEPHFSVAREGDVRHEDAGMHVLRARLREAAAARRRALHGHGAGAQTARAQPRVQMAPPSPHAAGRSPRPLPRARSQSPPASARAPAPPPPAPPLLAKSPRNRPMRPTRSARRVDAAPPPPVEGERHGRPRAEWGARRAVLAPEWEEGADADAAAAAARSDGADGEPRTQTLLPSASANAQTSSQQLMPHPLHSPSALLPPPHPPGSQHSSSRLLKPTAALALAAAGTPAASIARLPSMLLAHSGKDEAPPLPPASPPPLSRAEQLDRLLNGRSGAARYTHATTKAAQRSNLLAASAAAAPPPLQPQQPTRGLDATLGSTGWHRALFATELSPRRSCAPTRAPPATASRPPAGVPRRASAAVAEPAQHAQHARAAGSATSRPSAPAGGSLAEVRLAKQRFAYEQTRAAAAAQVAGAVRDYDGTRALLICFKRTALHAAVVGTHAGRAAAAPSPRFDQALAAMRVGAGRAAREFVDAWRTQVAVATEAEAARAAADGLEATAAKIRAQAAAERQARVGTPRASSPAKVLKPRAGGPASAHTAGGAASRAGEPASRAAAHPPPSPRMSHSSHETAPAPHAVPASASAEQPPFVLTN
jgi:hypothetical protein